MRRAAATIVLLLALAAPAAAQSTPQTIALLEEGFFRAYRNELALDTKRSFRDPVKLRMGAWWTDSYLAIVSGDLLSGDERNPRRDERGFFGIRHNDSYPKDYNAACQRTRLRLTTDALEIFGRRIELSTSTIADHIAAVAWGLYVQTDGNLVLYERVGGTPCPRWAISWLPHNGTGFIDRAVLAPPCN